MDAIMNGWAEELEQAADVGPKVAESIRAFFAEKQNVDLVKRLAKAGVTMEQAMRPKPAATHLAGKTLGLTGTLPNYSREAAQKPIEHASGKATTTGSHRTDMAFAHDE